MKPVDISLAVLVAVIWGLSFVASRLALDQLSPALMTMLRFAVAAIPCFFARKPDVSLGLLLAIGCTLFLGQFLPQAYGLAHRVPVGLTSVIVQSQALFTIAFAALVFGDLPTPLQSLGVGIATAGLLMICGTVGFDFSVGSFLVLMISPISFAIGNLLLRQVGDVPMFDLFAWLCLVPPLPLLVLALTTDGPDVVWHSLTQISMTTLACVIGLGVLSTSMAYGLWGRLLRDYKAAQVTPFALLAPFVGAGASALIFGERFGALRLSGMMIVVCGIAIMLLSKRSSVLPKLV